MAIDRGGHRVIDVRRPIRFLRRKITRSRCAAAVDGDEGTVSDESGGGWGGKRRDEFSP